MVLPTTIDTLGGTRGWWFFSLLVRGDRRGSRVHSLVWVYGGALGRARLISEIDRVVRTLVWVYGGA